MITLYVIIQDVLFVLSPSLSLPSFPPSSLPPSFLTSFPPFSSHGSLHLLLLVNRRGLQVPQDGEQADRNDHELESQDVVEAVVLVHDAVVALGLAREVGEEEEGEGAGEAGLENYVREGSVDVLGEEVGERRPEGRLESGPAEAHERVAEDEDAPALVSARKYDEDTGESREAHAPHDEDWPLARLRSDLTEEQRQNRCDRGRNRGEGAGIRVLPGSMYYLARNKGAEEAGGEA